MRRRARRCREISPACSSTRRCLVMAGWLIGNGGGHVEDAGVALAPGGRGSPASSGRTEHRRPGRARLGRSATVAVDITI